MIGNLLKNIFTKGLYTKRWNNYPRIEDVSLIDNIGYVLHIALFLTYLEQELNQTKLNKEFIIKRTIFNSFKTLILSDINSGTKSYIIKKNKDIFFQLEEKAIMYFLSFEGPKYIKDDIKNTILNTSFKKELDIIEASKKLACYQEAEINSKIYFDMYEIPLKEIKLGIESDRKNLKSFDILLKNHEYIKYLGYIRRLSHCMRWNQENRIFPISVMSHLVITTFITYILVMIENHENNKNFDLLNMLLIALYHDIPEAITGDIITPTKKFIPGFSNILEKVEIDMMNDYLFSCIPKNYKNKIYDFMLNPFKGEKGSFVKYADVLSALFEAKIEVNHGNKSFLEIYKVQKKRVNTFYCMSVDYLLKYGLDSFDETEIKKIID